MWFKAKYDLLSLISEVCCSVNEIFVLVGCYVKLIGSYLGTFRRKLSVASSRVIQSKMKLLGFSLRSVVKAFGLLKMLVDVLLLLLLLFTVSEFSLCGSSPYNSNK